MRDHNKQTNQQGPISMRKTTDGSAVPGDELESSKAERHMLKPRRRSNPKARSTVHNTPPGAAATPRSG